MHRAAISMGLNFLKYPVAFLAPFLLLSLIYFIIYSCFLSATITITITIIVLVFTTSFLIFSKSKKIRATGSITQLCAGIEILKKTQVPAEVPELKKEVGQVDLNPDLHDDPVEFSVDRSTPCSGDSIPDDESLIEITLPDGHTLGAADHASIVQPNSCGFQSDFSMELLFRKHGQMELLTEINEEDNLIEIDITMGSIKCSRVEIEA